MKEIHIFGIVLSIFYGEMVVLSPRWSFSIDHHAEILIMCFSDNLLKHIKEIKKNSRIGFFTNETFVVDGVREIGLANFEALM